MYTISIPAGQLREYAALGLEFESHCGRFCFSITAFAPGLDWARFWFSAYVAFRGPAQLVTRVGAGSPNRRLRRRLGAPCPLYREEGMREVAGLACLPDGP